MLIFFLIYINRIFEAVIKNNLIVTFLLFINDLKFIVPKILVQKIFKMLEMVVLSVLWWGFINVVIYNILKTKAVLFSKSHYQQLNKQL